MADILALRYTRAIDQNGMGLFEGVLRGLRPQESGAGEPSPAETAAPRIRVSEFNSRALRLATSYEPIDNRASLLTVAKYRSGNLLVEKRAAST